ncbi:MAG TPA: hypothetical protein VK550_20565 [Polyangiaceae bacterium]|nr:hypothetical protein [Polyangiaceae bacterium]
MQHFGQIKLLLLIIGAALLGGCAENRYLFRPSQQATAQVSGLPAARYAIPPEKPQGEVLVVSTGVTEIKPDNVPTRALFARVIVANNSDETTWRLDTRKQAAVLGNNRIAPTYVNTFGQTIPVVEIAKGEKRTIDFYFPVPAGTETNGDLPQFDLSWNVETGTRAIAERTSFDRYRVEPVYSGGYYGYGYGYGYPYYPYRWGYYDPFWGPHYSIYYGRGWGGGWGHGHWGGGGGWYGGGGGHIGGGGGGARPSYSRPSVQRR